MSTATVETNVKPAYDKVICDIADYVMSYKTPSETALQTAALCLQDSLGCAMLALNHPQCVALLGPIVEGTTVLNGVAVPGTEYQLDPVQAAFNIGTMIRWLDFNDTWLAAEWGHPSDNLGAILAVANYVSQLNEAAGKPALTICDVLIAMIKAYEIQGVLALENSFNRVGLDHVVLVKVASTAVVTQMLGGDIEAVKAAISQAWVDGQSLRTYRHAPNAGSRKSWAAGDATSRAVRLAMLTLKGEPGYPSALTAKTWGFYDVSFGGKPFVINRPFESYVMENILLKISFPAEFHAQTAVECAVTLHPEVRDRFNDIEKITLTTHESAIRIISKTGELHNYADRDHCLQYMVAIGLLHGDLTADHYNDEAASDPRIDQLREKMEVTHNEAFTQDYLDPEKRSIANAMQIHFNDGTATDAVTVEYPIGHRRNRDRGIPVLKAKARANFMTRFDEPTSERLMALFDDEKFIEMSVLGFMSSF